MLPLPTLLLSSQVGFRCCVRPKCLPSCQSSAHYNSLMAILDNGKIAVGKTVCNHQTIGGLGRVRLSKSLGKTNFRGTATVAFLTVMMAQICCHSAATTSQRAIDTGDENVAKTKLAEAEPL